MFLDITCYRQSFFKQPDTSGSRYRKFLRQEPLLFEHRQERFSSASDRNGDADHPRMG
uniref:Uncharacterized protein n=1 Tax=Magnetococcus massalia (strain MO-1) TaxID=451514 RepID=A0A1S7LKX2_MAGMO|nr:protein of unknown function [Candidatus Magnetococcus massalia]